MCVLDAYIRLFQAYESEKNLSSGGEVTDSEHALVVCVCVDLSHTLSIQEVEMDRCTLDTE